jgi:hypothetical protein
LGICANSKASCGLPTFIMILTGSSGISPRCDLGDLGLEQAVVDVAGVALGAGHGDQRAVGERSVASPQPTTAGMPSSRAMIAAWQVRPPRLVTMAAGALHHRLPVGVGHVGDQHVAGLHAVHLASRDQPHRAGADLLADGAAGGEHRPRSPLSLKRCSTLPSAWLFTVSGRACRM